MKNAIVSVSRQDEWLEVIARLEKTGECKPLYWITFEENHDDVVANFPNTICHRRMDINRGIPLERFRNFFFQNHTDVDIYEYTEELNTIIDIFERHDLDNSMPLFERRRLADSLLCYWLNIIDELDIDLVIFGQPPHSIANYSLYVAMKIMQKATYIFKYTPIDNLYYIAFSNEEVPAYLVETYREYCNSDGNEEKVSQRARDSIYAVKNASVQYKPWYVKSAKERNDKHYQTTKKIDSLVNRKFSYYDRLNISEGPFGARAIREKKASNSDRRIPRTFKLPDRALSGDWISVEEFKNYRDWAYSRKYILREKYKKFVSRVPRNTPYVYFGLHFQPERTTIPDGGQFGPDSFRCISLLRSSLPDEIAIVVKEHPSQFVYTGMGEQARWLDYYEAFMELPNVHFVPQDEPNLTLMDNALAVASITGTTGWEALIRGKPVLCFGHAWYAECVGAYKIDTIESVRAAITEIMAGSKPDMNSLWAFVAAVELHGGRAFTTPSLERGFEGIGDLTEQLYALITNAMKQPQ